MTTLMTPRQLAAEHPLAHGLRHEDMALKDALERSALRPLTSTKRLTLGTAIAALLACAPSAAQAAVVCSTASSGNVTLDPTPCLNNGGALGTVTVGNTLGTALLLNGLDRISILNNAQVPVTGARSITTINIPSTSNIDMQDTVNPILIYNTASVGASATISSINNDGAVKATHFLINASFFINPFSSNYSIGSITNNGTIETKGNVIFNTGSITSVTNTNLMKSGENAISNIGGTISSITNSGTLSSTNGVTIYNATQYNDDYTTTYTASIGTLTNSGTISSAVSHAINNDEGTIQTLTNTGTIQGGGGYAAIKNSYGVINTFNNGGSVTYKGVLPINYYIIVTSATGYGQLIGTGISSTMQFGVSPTSTLAAGTYAGVLQGIQGSNIGNLGSITGKPIAFSSRLGWYLSDGSVIGDGIWDLVVAPLGPDAANTKNALRNNAAALRGVQDRRLSGLAAMTGHDCQTFDKAGVCASFQARYASSDTMSSGAGVLTAAYRLSDRVRLGAFIDYSAGEKQPAGIRLSDPLPTFGAFAGFSQNANGTGLQAKAVAAAQKGAATITRSGDAELGTEPGAGKASLNAFVVSGELGWGFALSPSMIATPYVGVRYADASRGAYAEAAYKNVEFPIAYNGFHQRLTTATAGVRLSGMLSEKVGYQIGAGLEHDLRQQTSAYSGASTIPDLETFALKVDGVNNRTRGVGSVAMFYQVEQNQRLIGSVSIRNQAYTSQTAMMVSGGYQIGF